MIIYFFKNEIFFSKIVVKEIDNLLENVTKLETNIYNNIIYDKLCFFWKIKSNNLNFKKFLLEKIDTKYKIIIYENSFYKLLASLYKVNISFNNYFLLEFLVYDLDIDFSNKYLPI